MAHFITLKLQAPDLTVWEVLAAIDTLESGTGTGAANSFTDSSKSWLTNQWSNCSLVDSLGAKFLISSNTATVLTIVGTPANGAYTIEAVVLATSLSSGSTNAPHLYNSSSGTWLLRVTNNGELETVNEAGTIDTVALADPDDLFWAVTVDADGILGMSATFIELRVSENIPGFVEDISPVSVTISSLDDLFTDLYVEANAANFMSASETVGLSVDDTALVLSLLDSSESIEAVLSEDTQTIAQFSSTDPAVTDIEYNRVLHVTQEASDLLSAGLIEEAVALVSQATADQLAALLSEEATESVYILGDDSVATGISEIAENSVFVLAQDQIRAELSDMAAILVSSDSTDSIPAGFSEAVLILIESAASDLAAIGLSDLATVQDLLAELLEVVSSDTIAALMSETPTIYATVSASDSAQVGTTESPSVLAILSAIDSASNGLTEDASVTVNTTGSDSMVIVLEDSVQTVSIYIAASDSLPAGIDESIAAYAETFVSDGLAVVTSEVINNLYGELSGQDTIVLALAEVGTKFVPGAGPNVMIARAILISPKALTVDQISGRRTIKTINLPKNTELVTT